ncbi:tetratricopeptide (TPR) repeat protein [Elusimicrobium posterum]|uniref:tetratricopeptide repeat protein n=1 Tax=Elusimicrobium posterum TaxID=3116653 RepID=UPI003C70F579
MKKVLFTVIFIFCAFFAFAEQPQVDPMVYANKGISAIYDLDFDTAQQNMDLLFEQIPNHPYAHFGNMLIAWMRYSYGQEQSDEAFKKNFETVLASSIKGIRVWLKDHPKDPQALMAIGATYGLKSFYSMDNGSWVSAYFSARKGVGFMKEAIEVDPECYDAYFALGMYEYYTGTLTSVVKVLAKVVAIKGDPAKGIEYLNLSASKGGFTQDSSKLMLVDIYNDRTTKLFDPATAQKYINEVAAKHPANPLLEFVKVIVNYENKNYADVVKDARAFMAKIGEVEFYEDIYYARAYTGIGTGLMAQGKWEEAAKVFEEAKKKTVDGQALTRWAAWNLLRLGQCYDALGERDKAVKTYKFMQEQKNLWNFEDEPKKYLKHPFTKESDLGAMPPL